MSALLWSVQCPFRVQLYKTTNKIKYIHIICILIGLLFPMLPIIASMADFAADIQSDESLMGRNITFASGGMGYGLTRFPPILCTSTDRNVGFYALILPINIMLPIGITILILLLWSFHRVSVNYRLYNTFALFNFVISLVIIINNKVYKLIKYYEIMNLVYLWNHAVTLMLLINT